MKKKILKKVITIFMLLLFSINAFAAVVADNDGAAFITKAEFDSLKNSFQSEIDQYNSTIDSKIDNAIASYISGVKTGKTYELTNIYDVLGGSNIKFVLCSNFTPTVEPRSAWALYFLDCWQNGFICPVLGAGYQAIKNPSEGAWISSGGGISGKFVTYDLLGGYRYLKSYKVGFLQACYVGGWYRVAELVNVTQNYPYGSSPTVLGESCVRGSTTNVDCATSFYRAYLPSDVDLSNFTFSRSFDTTSSANIVSIESDEYNRPSSYRTLSNYSGQGAAAGSVGSYKVTINNIRLYDWTKTKNDIWNFNPGFYKNKPYKNSIYGGVHFFKAKEDGIVKIEDLRFDRYSEGDVYFAINSREFGSTTPANLSGDVEITKLVNAYPVPGSGYLYSARSGTDVKLEFNVKKDCVYYIKCTPQLTDSDSWSVYCGINTGAKITLTTEG